MAGNVIWNMPEWNIPPYPTLEVGIYIGVHTKYRLTPFYISALKISV
jgi:hypothetical protein